MFKRQEQSAAQIFTVVTRNGCQYRHTSQSWLNMLGQGSRDKIMKYRFSWLLLGIWMLMEAQLTEKVNLLGLRDNIQEQNEVRL